MYSGRQTRRSIEARVAALEAELAFFRMGRHYTELQDTRERLGAAVVALMACEEELSRVRRLTSQTVQPEDHKLGNGLGWEPIAVHRLDLIRSGGSAALALARGVMGCE